MRRFIRLLPFLILGVAVAQMPLVTFDGGALGYRLGYPSAWVLEKADDASYLNIQPPPGAPDAGRVAIELLVDPDVTGTLAEGVEEVLAELRANLLPDLAVQSRTETTVSGVPAVVVLLNGTFQGTHPVTYRLVIALQGRSGYVLFLEALREHYAAYAPLFDQVQASFVLTQDQAAPAPAPPPSPVPPPVGAPDYAGTFVGEQLLLTLAASPLPGGAYTGTLDHGGNRYPVSAQATPQGLAGDFESGGNRFPFTATLAANQLTFVTGGVSYLLTREVAAPIAPVNPLAVTPPPGPLSADPVPPEVVASETGTAEIGAVAPNGRARGRLEGLADGLTFHAYYVDVPAGATRLTIELDADADLDLAVKFGSETSSFADKDRGGDWDYRDVGTQNPTTIVIERPNPGRWYVDVLNILGANRTGSYVLTLTTAGVGDAATPPVTPVSPLTVTPPAPPEIVADQTGSAFIGVLPANGRGRGRLNGVADAFGYHTYVVDVPAGATRLTIVLDADADLDIAAKFGSDILSYADKDRGGDWDYRDIGTQNPTTIVIERPNPGRWYIDVINALGAGQNGNYTLTVAVGGG